MNQRKFRTSRCLSPGLSWPARSTFQQRELCRVPSDLTATEHARVLCVFWSLKEACLILDLVLRFWGEVEGWGGGGGQLIGNGCVNGSSQVEVLIYEVTTVFHTPTHTVADCVVSNIT